MVEDKIRETRLRWFCRVQRRPIDATIRKSDCLDVTRIQEGEEDLKRLG